MILDFLIVIGVSILIVGLVCVLVVVPDIIIYKINDKKEKKKEEEYKEQGIEKRWAIMGRGFYIFKNNGDEVFYLNKDGNFYNTTTNIQEYNFDNEEELNKYIEDDIEELKEKYGDVQLKKYVKHVYLGYCKQI